VRPIQAPDPTRGEILVLPAATEVVRIYFAGGPHPVDWNQFRDWGPSKARFDHHIEPPGDADDGRAILYAGSDLLTCVGEVFQRTRQVDVVAGEPYYAMLRIRRPIRLLSLHSDWPTRAGASQALSSGIHASARAWSRAIWEDLPDVEGIAYPSSMVHGGSNYAFYERAAGAFEPDPVFNLVLAHRGLRAPLRNAANALNYGLVLVAARGPFAASATRVRVLRRRGGGSG
jgi:hypothetical protein